ncbi:MAG: hypothetical protein UV78_C0007G0004 [Parcubacteria group bacterium GW2011_GWA2_43_17]|nr:MAG: hypothetical protein UV78_C0007G0004 [Parcubacteria group bacterium GW2011_GWA2_43_17]KKT93490.1 MAG: hypothetical protein UW91_C0009G0014 [Parcubacteria group bacterium GW2011_GWF2_45_11]
MKRHKSTRIVSLVALAICLLSLLRIAPYFYKGQSPWLGYRNLNLARNMALSGKFSVESQQNIFLSSKEISSQGQIANTGNSLTPVIYSWIFKAFGFNYNLPVFVSVILSALTSVLIFLLIFRLLGLWPALLAASLDLFLPVNWLGALAAGFYEWAMLFFALGLVCYFWQTKTKVWQLILAGLCFGLAVLSRNAFLVSVPAVFIFEFMQTRNLKRLLALGLPLVVIFVLWIAPGWLSPEQFNTYLAKTDTDLGRYGHLFNDPYTYHYNQENFINEVLNDKHPDTLDFFVKYGYEVSFIDRIKVYANSALYYLVEFIRLINYGGPLIALLMIFGLGLFKKRQLVLFKFFSIWLASWYVALIYLRTNNWDHFLEIKFIVLATASYAATFIIHKLFDNSLKLKRASFILLAGCLILHSFLAAKWLFHEEYNTSQLDNLRQAATRLNQSSLDRDEVVASGGSVIFNEGLNYFTDQSIIFFHPQTIKELYQQNKISEAFDKFKVVAATNFEPEIMSLIKEQTTVKIIE